MSERSDGSASLSGENASSRTLPCSERVRHDVGEAELRVRRRGRLAVARDIEGRAVGRDMDLRDVAGRPAGARHQGERPVDGREGVPAAAVVLERHRRDVEDPAEAFAGAVPVGAVAHGPAQARLAVDRVERPRHAFARGQRREHAGFRGAPGVQRLRHRVACGRPAAGPPRRSSPSRARGRTARGKGRAACRPPRRRRSCRRCRSCASSDSASGRAPRRSSWRSRSPRRPRAGRPRRSRRGPAPRRAPRRWWAPPGGRSRRGRCRRTRSRGRPCR